MTDRRDPSAGRQNARSFLTLDLRSSRRRREAAAALTLGIALAAVMQVSVWLYLAIVVPGVAIAYASYRRSR